MANIKRLVIFLFISAVGISAQDLGREPTQRWDPTRTWVVAVGILEWADGETWDSFPKAGRKDAELVEFLSQAGVPQDQVLFLKDREATKERVERMMARHISRAREGDMLIFYFTGHGAQDDDGNTYFASYDAGEDLAQTALSIKSIFRIIELNFRGNRALLTADCCYSGALADEAAKRRSPIAYAALTSSRSDSLSTADWTFTDALLRGFKGNAKVDRNLDGEIALSEIARYAKSRMWSVEGQLTTFTTTRDFSADMRLAEVARRQTATLSERVEVEWKNQWYPATVLEVKGSRYKIHYLGYGAEWDEWIDGARLRRKTVATSSGERLSLVGNGLPPVVRRGEASPSGHSKNPMGLCPYRRIQWISSLSTCTAHSLADTLAIYGGKAPRNSKGVLTARLRHASQPAASRIEASL